MRLIDLTGQRFGKLTVIERTQSTNKNAKWICECECGKIVSVFGADLRSGKTKSCGCLFSEQLARRNYKHGLSKCKLVDVWRGMKNRCCNPNNEAYDNYGGRGITICDEWINDFESFYNWSISNGYSDNLSIDRIDNDKGYSPDNCRWATRKEQANNKRTNRRIYYKGVTLTAREWENATGINSHTIIKRLEMGWDVEKALTTIPKKR